MHKHTMTRSSTDSEFPDDRRLLLLIFNGEGCCRYRATHCRGFDGSVSGWPGKLLRILIAPPEHWCEECAGALVWETLWKRRQRMKCGYLRVRMQTQRHKREAKVSTPRSFFMRTWAPVCLCQRKCLCTCAFVHANAIECIRRCLLILCSL